ncbi:MAG: tetratricopeptide repeat protein [Acidobacteriota bacterium]
MRKGHSPKLIIVLTLLSLLTFLSVASCAPLFRRRPSQPPPRQEPPPKTAPAELPARLPSQPQPTLPAPAPKPVQPKPESSPAPKVEKPALPSDQAASQLIAQGWDCVSNKKLDLAETKFEKALRIAPTSGSAYYGMAQVAYLRTNYAQCLELAQSAELYSFQEPSLLLKAYILEGDCLARMGKRDKAVDAYRKALELDPGSQYILEKLKRMGQ